MGITSVKQRRKTQISVREFALPVPRTGSIETHSGFGPVPQQGLQIHAELQAVKAALDHNYIAEHSLNYEFTSADLQVRVSGRVDGFYSGSEPLFEEIKSAFDAPELIRRLRAQPQHPYWLQLLTYLYIHFKNTGDIARGQLLVVSSRNKKETTLTIELDILAYETWLELRLAEVLTEATAFAQRKRRRKQLGNQLAFPFPTQRPGQAELQQLIAAAVPHHQHLIIEAPTGMGKTLAILLPTLRQSLQAGAPTIFITPKNSQHAAPEHAARQIGGLRTLTLTAKARICMKSTPVCNPQACEYAKDYYEKVAKHDLIAKLGRKRAVTAATLKGYAERYEVCPAELGMDSAVAFDLVIGDYNYVIQALGLVSRVTAKHRGKKNRPALVIDEAHNLYTRATENRSAVLSTAELTNLGRDAATVVEDCTVIADTIAAIANMGPTTRTLTFDPVLLAAFEALNDRWNMLAAKYLSSDAEITEADPVLRVTAYWRAFFDVLALAAIPLRLDDGEADAAVAGVNPYACLYEPTRTDQCLRVLCCDASAHLASCFEPFARVIAFSATLRPFDFYAKVSGLDLANLGTAAFTSPFPACNRKVLVIPQVSTKLRDRRHNLEKIATAITKLTAARPGHYMALFPSFQFLRDVAAHISAPGYQILQQTAGMTGGQTTGLVNELRTATHPLLVLGVQGGSLAEGVDYPGDQLIGVVVVGPALPNCDEAREVLRRYYERAYDPRLGYDYAYTYPAMAKVVQAAGRVIRTDQDRGLIVLMDARFVEPRYSALLPLDWFKDSVQELVSRSILAEVQEFWQGGAVLS